MDTGGNGHIRRASRNDIAYLVANLRNEDKEEIQASSGNTPEEGLEAAMSLEDPCWVGVCDDGPWVIWGNIGSSIWCLATTQIDKHKSAFIRISIVWLASLEFTKLNCFTDSRNKEHHRWLKATGFKRTGTPLFFHDPHVEFHEYVRIGV